MNCRNPGFPGKNDFDKAATFAGKWFVKACHAATFLEPGSTQSVKREYTGLLAGYRRWYDAGVFYPLAGIPAVSESEENCTNRIEAMLKEGFLHRESA